MSSAEPYPEEYLEGIRLFNAREYYDAHEAWEEKWMHIGDSSADFWKGLIQIAVATLHWERGNHVGARRMIRRGINYVRPFGPEFLGLEVEPFLQQVEDHYQPLFQAVEQLKSVPRPNPDTAPRIKLK